MSEYSVICIIPARGGSKGLSRKNLRELDGTTLLERPIKHALESGVIDTVLVTTDDSSIAETALKAGAEVPFMRPKDLSEDLSTTEETIQHALLTYESLTSRKYEIGVFLTATDIFRQTKWIREAVEKLKSNSNLESVFSGHKTHKNFWEKNKEGKWERICSWMSEYSSRQTRQAIVREDTGLVCASRAYLWREGRRIGDRVEIIINDDDLTGIDIHDEEDLKLAQAALNIRKNIK